MLTASKLLIYLWVAFWASFGATCSFAQEPPDSQSSPAAQRDGVAGPIYQPVQPASAATPVYGFKIVRIYPHDANAFTQGLIFDHGFLFESTGLVGRSTIRKVRLETGKVLKSYTLPGGFFGEGLTLWNDRLIQLTWLSRIGFVYDKQSFAKLSEFRYQTEGWGITDDDKSLIMSDGTATLRFLNPYTFTETGRIEVKDRGRPVSHLNELEYVKGEIFANIWLTDKVARISPETGRVLGWISLHGLRKYFRPGLDIDVLNGIAYDPRRDRIFVTGKLWPKLFEIKIGPKRR